VSAFFDVLYKYTRAEFAQGMVQRGEFLIGTLHGFRRMEEHGMAIGDAGEGKKEVVDAADGHWRDITARPNLATKFISAPSQANITFSNVQFQMNYDVSDVYVYCVSAARNDRVMQAFDADACVTIKRPKEFFIALDKALRLRRLVSGCMVRPCEYTERRRDVRVDADLHPAFIKTPDYAYQEEVRALWEPRQRPIQPVLIHSLRAARFLKWRAA